VLKDDAGTRARFPFAFALAVEYRLAGRALDAHFSLANPGPQPLPFALGFHPGFRWPFAGGRKEDYSVLFAEAEDPNVPVITREGLFSAATRRVPLEGRRLPLDETVFAQEALCFLGAKSRSLRFVAGDGSAISMALEDFPHLALWSRPGAGFVCMEAWTGHGDPDGFAGDLTDKPSMRLLAPGASSHHAVRLAFHPVGTVEEPER
jgi:galactose mutarotase-like enzyme